MGIVAFIMLGLLASMVAKAMMPGRDPGGIFATALIGIAGAVLGGLAAAAIFGTDPVDEFFSLSTWITAVAGSMLLLAIHRAVAVDRGKVGRAG